MMLYNTQNFKQVLKDTCRFLHFQVHRLSTKSLSNAINIKRGIGIKNTFSDWKGKQDRKKKFYLPPLTPSVYFWSCLCPDRGFGLVFWRQGLPKKQLEHPGRDAGVDFGHRHPGVAHLQLRHQDPGHAQGLEAAEDAKAAAVSELPGDVIMQRTFDFIHDG